MTLVEKMARAIADANMEHFEDAPHLHSEMALAALKAIEPTEAMLAAMEPVLIDASYSLREIFMAGIAAAIAEAETAPSAPETA